MKDEKEIIERVLKGETDAFRVIVDRYGEMVLRICARILNDPDEAQDIARRPSFAHGVPWYDSLPDTVWQHGSVL